MNNIQLKDIDSFEKLENYINSNREIINSLKDRELQEYANRKLQDYNIPTIKHANPFEDTIFQDMAGIFWEEQLFFVRKSYKYKNFSLEKLKNEFHSVIVNRYDKHQEVRVGEVNRDGDIWTKRYFFDPQVSLWEYNEWRERHNGPADLYKPMGSLMYKAYWKVLKENFNTSELNILLEDDDIIIFTIFMKCDRSYYDVGTNEMSFYQNGYFIQEDRLYDIIPYKEPYTYHYQIIKNVLLEQRLEKTVMTRLRREYRELQKEIFQNLSNLKKESEERCNLILQKRTLKS